MARTTKVMGFSLPPQLHSKLEKLAKQKHKTRSEFMREMIEVYLDVAAGTRSASAESNLANVLQTYWLLKADSPLTIIVTGLAIITNHKGQVLIGARTKQPDEIVKNLTWSFPGSKLESLDFANELKVKLKAKTGLAVSVDNLIASRIFPDSSLGSTQIITLYFACKLSGGKLKSDGTYSNYKWVNPLEVFRYFTTSTSDEVTKYLSTLSLSSSET